MDYPATDLFIVNSNTLMAYGLKQYLYQRLGKALNVFSFFTDEKRLEKVDQHTGFVVLSYSLAGKDSYEMQSIIKKIHPVTEALMASSDKDTATGIESFQEGSTWYFIKDNDEPGKRKSDVIKATRKMRKKIASRKFIVLFFAVFILLGLAVFFVLNSE